MASWARKAAFTGACPRSSRASCIRRAGTLSTSVQTLAVMTWRMTARFFSVRPSWRYSSSVALRSSEAFESLFAEASGLAGNREEFPPQLDGVGLGLAAVLLSVRVDHTLDEVGIEKPGERGQLLARHPDAHGLAHKGPNLRPAGPNGARLRGSP